MKTVKQKLNELDKQSSWVFAKQFSDYDEAFKATKLFSNMPENVDIESYFREYSAENDINTDRHRIFSSAQLFGLITKTPFYKKGQYKNEKTTEVFDLIKHCNIGDYFYNQVKTEQLLKLKIRAITNTKTNVDYCVFPILFIYKVLKKLKDENNIINVSLEHLFTYIMTCSKFEQIEEAARFILVNGQNSEYVAHYKDASRILVILKSINLFSIDSKGISINNEYENYFNDNFNLLFNYEQFPDYLSRDVDYAYFLYTPQNFNINLIDKPNEISNINLVKITEKDLNAVLVDKENELEFLKKVDEIKEANLNVDIGIDAYKQAPVLSSQSTSGRNSRVNPYLTKIAILEAKYKCENNNSHTTFLSNSTNKPYMEGHHLIPVRKQQEYWDKYKMNLDCPENIICLCPTCHRAFHFGSNEVKKNIIKNIFLKRKEVYDSINLPISEEILYEIYNVIE